MTDPYLGPERRSRLPADHSLHELMQSTIRATITELQAACLSAPEQQWVRLAIAREERRTRVWQAVLEKSLSGLAWSALVGIGYLIINWLKDLRGVH